MSPIGWQGKNDTSVSVTASEQPQTRTGQVIVRTLAGRLCLLEMKRPWMRSETILSKARKDGDHRVDITFNFKGKSNVGVYDFEKQRVVSGDGSETVHMWAREFAERECKTKTVSSKPHISVYGKSLSELEKEV